MHLGADVRTFNVCISDIMNPGVHTDLSDSVTT